MILAHGVHGISGSFGYLELGACAAALEFAVRKTIESGAKWDSKHIDRLATALLGQLDSVAGNDGLQQGSSAKEGRSG
jgi:hypothetical protein